MTMTTIKSQTKPNLVIHEATKTAKSGLRRMPGTDWETSMKATLCSFSQLIIIKGVFQAGFTPRKRGRDEGEKGSLGLRMCKRERE